VAVVAVAAAATSAHFGSPDSGGCCGVSSIAQTVRCVGFTSFCSWVVVFFPCVASGAEITCSVGVG
ncbi:MAG: hypothetical protein P9G45_10075, partial [Candidatus Contendobacter sp.]|nr:hypothetical protein [Candidatus Contendobacter sp.]